MNYCSCSAQGIKNQVMCLNRWSERVGRNWFYKQSLQSSIDRASTYLASFLPGKNECHYHGWNHYLVFVLMHRFISSNSHHYPGERKSRFLRLCLSIPQQFVENQQYVSNLCHCLKVRSAAREIAQRARVHYLISGTPKST